MGAAHADSPWIEQLDPDGPPEPLDGDVSTDVVIIGAGIAGVATAFFTLRDTDTRVLLVERDRVGRGATGHNAGQLTTYFERPLCDLVDTYGFEPAIAAQRAIDETFDLLDVMIAESGATAPIERFVGHMGMYTLEQLVVHLRCNACRRAGGLFVPACVVADDAPFVGRIPDEFAGLYEVVPRARVTQLLGTDDDRYCAVLSDRKGCANGALLCQQVLRHLRTTRADRFRFADTTPVERIVLGDTGATVHAGGRVVTASHVVMCTNGFVDHVVENTAGDDIHAGLHHRVDGTVGFMVAFVEPEPRPPVALSFIRNAVIGGDTPYVYVTARPHRKPGETGTLVCVGGPESCVQDITDYSPESTFPAEILDELDEEVLHLVAPGRPSHAAYDYQWHGLMGYTASRLRVIGAEPANPVLLYNLGCNGVGFLPSIFGGRRIASLLRGDDVEPMIFDPPAAR